MTFTITASIAIKAPLERCFALSTRVELVRETLGLEMVGGVTSGHVTEDSRVVWKGWKFGVPAEHHTLITKFAAPHEGKVGDPATEFNGQQVAWFEDSQEKGRFTSFRHIHLFRDKGDSITLEDTVWFSLPFGWAGQMVGRFIVAPHVRKLVAQRFRLIQQLAEGEGWRQYLAESLRRS